MDEEEDAREINLKIFKEMIDIISACRLKENQFSCKTCDFVGDCIYSISCAVATIASWIADEIESDRGKDLIKKVDTLKDLIIKEDSSKMDNSKHLYM